MGVDISTIVLSLIVLVISLAIVIILVLALRRTGLFKCKFRGTDDVESFTVTVVGSIYGIIMAFMIFVVWSKYDATNQAVQNEVTNLAVLYRLTESLPAPLRSELRRDCREYVTVMTEDEWPAMAHGGSSPRAWQLVNHMWDVISGLTPEKLPDEVLHDHVLTTFTLMTNYRRYRLFRANEMLPLLLWIILVFGGTLTVFLSAIFHVDSTPQHLIKTAALAAIISLSLLAVWDLNGPFDGPLRISSDVFKEATVLMQT